MTDHPGYPTDDDAAWAPRLLARERAEDAAYAVRAWSRGFAWLTLCAALGATFTALSQGDWLAVAAGLTAVVAVFLPRIQSRLVYQVIKTEFMRRRLIDRDDAPGLAHAGDRQGADVRTPP